MMVNDVTIKYNLFKPLFRGKKRCTFECTFFGLTIESVRLSVRFSGVFIAICFCSICLESLTTTAISIKKPHLFKDAVVPRAELEPILVTTSSLISYNFN